MGGRKQAKRREKTFSLLSSRAVALKAKGWENFIWFTFPKRRNKYLLPALCLGER